jgi:arabinan endo-1,5-alpha-L-arabinosidase
MCSRTTCLGVTALSASLVLLSACGNVIAEALSYSPGAKAVLAAYPLTGETDDMRDPSIARQGATYYAFATDSSGAEGSSLLIRCSPDKVNWTARGAVFQHRPAWIATAVPGALLWAPDISYFHGMYHLYYAASTLGSQRSAIGLATNTTLDPSDPAYQWIDRGAVLASNSGDDFNAIDPNIFVDSDGSAWLTYGSYWSGIKQRAIDPATGMLSSADTTHYDLATRPGVPHNPIEGASLLRHGGYYYLFVSVDYCCRTPISSNNYKEAVGRATNPHGPFVDMQGTSMMNGGGTVIIEGNAAGDGSWIASGGGTAWIDPDTGDSLIVFHALDMSHGGAAHLWVKQIAWQDDWPVIQ